MGDQLFGANSGESLIRAIQESRDKLPPPRAAAALAM